MKSFFYFAAFGGAIAVLGSVGGACGGSSGATSLSTSTATTGASAGAGGAGGKGATSTSATSTGTAGTGGASATTGASMATTGGSGGACANGLGDACSDCTAAQCASTYCPCYNDSSCGALVLCLDKCPAGNKTCENTCFSDSPNAIAEALLLGNCAAISCDAECPGVMKTTPCELCTIEQCTAKFNTCFANPACAALVECVEAGGSLLSCGSANPGGVADAETLESCATSKCAASGC
jgi:hypothetical protein